MIEESGQIPTLSDLMERIDQRFVESVATDVMAEDVAADLAEIFTTGGNGDLFTLIAFARGCHSAAEVRDEQGAHDHARLLRAMGQDMLATAIDVLAGIAVVEIDLSGTARH